MFDSIYYTYIKKCPVHTHDTALAEGSSAVVPSSKGGGALDCPLIAWSSSAVASKRVLFAYVCMQDIWILNKTRHFNLVRTTEYSEHLWAHTLDIKSIQKWNKYCSHPHGLLSFCTGRGSNFQHRGRTISIRTGTRRSLELTGYDNPIVWESCLFWLDYCMVYGLGLLSHTFPF